MKSVYQELTALCRRYGITALYVFGSRAGEIAGRVRGQEVPQPLSVSDVDIGILLPMGRRLDVRDKVRLMADLEDLFEVGRVDLVVVSEASAFLALEVIRGELLYDADPDGTAEYELYVLRRAGDLLPFERHRRQQVLREGAS